MAGLPSGYSLAHGFYFGPSGDGPYVLDASGNLSLVANQTPIAPIANWVAYAAGAGGSTAGTAFVAFANQAGLRNYMTSLQVTNSSATGSEVGVRDGLAGTVLWRGFVPAGATISVTFSTPLRGSVNTAMGLQNVGAVSAIYFNAQGFTSAN